MRTMFFLVLSLVSSTVVADEALWKRLQTEPNLVVLMRHARTGGGNALAWDTTGKCKNERMLSQQGKEFSRRLGAEFRKRRIYPVVISSPMCRCLDTARLAFGSAVTDPDLREITTAGTDQKKAHERKARELLLKYRGVKPVVFISHRPNIDALTLEIVPIGDLLVGRIGVDGTIEVLGRIKQGR